MTNFRFIKSPNLPEGKVFHVVASAQYPQVLCAMENLGINTFSVSDCQDVFFPLRNHSDMLFAYLGNGRFSCEKSQFDLRDRLIKSGGVCVEDNISLESVYPSDVLLNFCIVGDNLICRQDIINDNFVCGRKLINVRQGYAKCSCIPVNENSLITDDSAIYSACSNAGLDVLYVSKGSVKLEGFDVGFIGGCCGKISKDTLAFCGDIRLHTDYIQINAFLRERKVYPLSLFNGKLTDIGSVIPVTEQ